MERYVNIFINNYVTIYRKLTSLGVNYSDIANPKIVYNNDTPNIAVENAIKKLEIVTGKKLQLIHDKRKYTTKTIMYSTRNRLRSEFKKTYPTDKKVFFYFPIDDSVRPEAVLELVRLSRAKEPTACMFRFFVSEGAKHFTAATRPITSYKDIHPGDWGRILCIYYF